MKILVTVGTTAFNSLIETVDVLAQEFSEIDWLSQIGYGSYEPVHHRYFRFIPEIFDRHPNRFVFTHCGAGSVYFLLERGRPFVAVPNMERNDPHQRELATFLERSGFALVPRSPAELRDLIVSEELMRFRPAPYIKDAFFVAQEIREFIDGPKSAQEKKD